MNPHAKVVQLWNKFFVISCLVAVFVDPLFFFLLGVQWDNKCIVLNGTMTTTIVVFRCVTDFMYILHILLQIMILSILPQFKGSSAAYYAKTHLSAAVFVQFIPRLYRILTMRGGQSSTGFIIESGWAYFNMNLLAYMLSSHVIGSCWYLFELQAVNLTTKDSIVTGYVYSLFWGFQQISTLAGNQAPSYFIREVLFTILALLLFGLLIGNMQDFLQALGRRTYEISKKLTLDLPHSVFSLEEVRIFKLLDVLILDTIYEKLRHKTYIQGSKILSRDGLVKRMTFIMHGKMLSEGEDGVVGLGGGDVCCGEELLAWCLGNSSPNKDGKRIRVPGQRLHSNRTVKCLTNVEAFALEATDLEEVTRLFARFLRNPQVQGAIRYVSPYWRSFAATGIQVAWRYRKKCITRDTNSRSLRSTK
ncbi:hypothetical protein CRG98_026125 [Punica granatum]|uniref:Cyclic nucleotide-binding domain-containing protein n=1 Tax=Punica granatum TaxID=22663 RepID=A0A2I0JB19_PUNGR|nr:hypothetical protein CRG98_026125 [Punica granatum]